MRAHAAMSAAITAMGATRTERGASAETDVGATAATATGIAAARAATATGVAIRVAGPRGPPLPRRRLPGAIRGRLPRHLPPRRRPAKPAPIARTAATGRSALDAGVDAVVAGAAAAAARATVAA